MRKSIEKAKKLSCDIKDVRDELNILKSAARFQRVVQRNLARGQRNLDISADYVENDIREMDEVASRIQSAVGSTKFSIANVCWLLYLPAKHDVAATTKWDRERTGADFSKSEQGPHDFYLCHASLRKSDLNTLNEMRSTDHSVAFVVPFFFVRVGRGFLSEDTKLGLCCDLWVQSITFMSKHDC